MPPGSKTTTKTTSGRRPGDDQRARDLLTWCRKTGIHVSRLTVGDVTIDGIVDLQRVPIPTADADSNPSDLRAQFGGAALDRLAADQQRDGANGVFAAEPDDD